MIDVSQLLTKDPIEFEQTLPNVIYRHQIDTPLVCEMGSVLGNKCCCINRSKTFTLHVFKENAFM